MTYVVGPDSPVHQVTEDEAVHLYSAGPPYWMTLRDAYRIAYHWSDFLPRMFELKPVFMAEVRGVGVISANQFCRFFVMFVGPCETAALCALLLTVDF